MVLIVLNCVLLIMFYDYLLPEVIFSPSFLFFLFFPPSFSFPFFKPFDYFSPPPTGGGNTEQYTGLHAWHAWTALYIFHFSHFPERNSSAATGSLTMRDTRALKSLAFSAAAPTEMTIRRRKCPLSWRRSRLVKIATWRSTTRPDSSCAPSANDKVCWG